MQVKWCSIVRCVRIFFFLEIRSSKQWNWLGTVKRALTMRSPIPFGEWTSQKSGSSEYVLIARSEVKVIWIFFFFTIIFTYFSVANNSCCLCFVSIHWWIIGFTRVQEFTWRAQSRTRNSFTSFGFYNIIVINWSAFDIEIVKMNSSFQPNSFTISLKMDYCTLIKESIWEWSAVCMY